jgi:hypothetical protein
VKSLVVLLTVVLLIINLVAGCAPGANQLKGTASGQGRVAGFWLGIWHGFIAPVAFVVSLFRSNVGIYDAHNNGAWYNLGYLFGLACFLRGGKGPARRNTRKCSDTVHAVC